MPKTALLWTLSVCALLVGASRMVAAPDAARVQDVPGIPTKPSVWVENRGIGQSVPVSLLEVAPDAFLRVQVAGTPAVSIAGANVLDTRNMRQPWEYLTISISGGENPVGKLEKLGADGWETTGLQFPADGTASRLLLLKRPR